MKHGFFIKTNHFLWFGDFCQIGWDQKRRWGYVHEDIGEPDTFTHALFLGSWFIAW